MATLTSGKKAWRNVNVRTVKTSLGISKSPMVWGIFYLFNFLAFPFFEISTFLFFSRIPSNITKNIIRRISDDNYFSLFPTTIFGFWFMTNHKECHNQSRFIRLTHKCCSITFLFYNPPWPFVCKHPSQLHNLPVILKIISRNFPKNANFSKNFHNYQKL